MNIPPSKEYYGIPVLDPSVVNHSHFAEAWHKAIEGDIRSPSDRDNVTLSEASWFKDGAGLEHECLVFTVNVQPPEEPQPPYKAFIAVERIASQEIVDAAAKAVDIAKETLPDYIVDTMGEVERTSVAGQIFDKIKEETVLIRARTLRVTSKLKASSNRASQKSKPNHRTIATDVISRVIAKNHSEVRVNLGMTTPVLLETFKFEPGTFPLRDLGIMVNEIHSLRRQYTLKQYNCYWFAGTLSQVLIEMKKPTRIPPEVVIKTAGCLMNYSVVRPDPKEVGYLVECISAKIAKDDKRIQREWEEGKGGKAESDARLVEERQDRERERQELEREHQDRIREHQEREREHQENETKLTAHIKQLQEELKKGQLSSMQTTTH